MPREAPHALLTVAGKTVRWTVLPSRYNEPPGGGDNLSEGLRHRFENCVFVFFLCGVFLSKNRLAALVGAARLAVRDHKVNAVNHLNVP